MASVALEHVGKTYRDRKRCVRAVDDFSLEVADREFVVLVGPSGCGKTTTLRLIAGLEEATEGTIKIGDRSVNRVAPKDRDVAMVFQNYALYPHMTAFKNMAFPLKMRKMRRADIKAKVHQVAAMLGIEHLLDRKPRDLSGGEKQRVAVGRAIVRRPRVFLFDEPLSNLDARLRVHMRTELKSLHRELNTTAIYVTHDQEEAMTLGDRLVIMKDGVLQQCGTPMAIYNTPANRFVAGFVGTPPMNFIEGRLDGSPGALTFAGAGGCMPLPRAPAAGIREDTAGTRKDDLCSNRSVVLGIRPEHLAVYPCESTINRAPSVSAGYGAGGTPPPLKVGNGQGAPPPPGVGDGPDEPTAVLTMTVGVIEPLGDRTHVHLTTPTGEHLIARTPSMVTVKPQQTVDVHLDLRHAHLFSADGDGRRLNARQGAS